MFSGKCSRRPFGHTRKTLILPRSSSRRSGTSLLGFERFHERLGLKRKSLRTSSGASPSTRRGGGLSEIGKPPEIREERWRQDSETLMQDVRHALRRLRKSPSTIGALGISLGLGIAASVFIFGDYGTVGKELGDQSGFRYIPCQFWLFLVKVQEDLFRNQARCP
jgi:hypothetical protein